MDARQRRNLLAQARRREKRAEKYTERAAFERRAFGQTDGSAWAGVYEKQAERYRREAARLRAEAQS